MAVLVYFYFFRVCTPVQQYLVQQSAVHTAAFSFFISSRSSPVAVVPIFLWWCTAAAGGV